MKLNNSAKKTMEVLKVIAQHNQGITLKEIVDILGYPKSSIYDILTTLKHLNYIKYEDEFKRTYVIGVNLFIIGNSYIQNDDLIKSSIPLVRNLGDKLGRTVFIGRETNGKVLYLHKYEPENAIITTSNIGSKVDLYNTALGKSILAFSKNQKQLISTITFRKYTENTITNEKELIKELSNVKMNGYAVDNREIEEHLSCVGAPIFDHTGSVIAAISVSGLYTKNIDIEYISRNVRETAYKISKQLGYQN